MNCLRCGYCCKNLAVVIVDDPELGIIENNLILHDGNQKACKHLIGDKPGEYKCAIHDYPWYVDTHCYRHTQIERNKNTDCRMGKYILNKLEK